MDRARVLAALNRRILETFSRRTVAALRAHLPVRLALAHFEAIVALNVAKEVRKDSAVIRAAGDALATGAPPGRETVLGLLEGTKEIDRAFLDQAGALPVRIVIRYEEVAPIRLARIELLLGAGYRILDAWQTAPGLRAALRAAYPEPEFERLLREVLHRYAQETHALSRSVRLPALLAPLRERLAGGLHHVMNDAATRLAHDVARVVQRRESAGPNAH